MLTPEQRLGVAEKRAAAEARRSEIAKRARLASLSALGQALHGATVTTTVDGQTVGSEVVDSLANLPSRAAGSGGAPARISAFDCSESDGHMSDDELADPTWFARRVFTDDAVPRA